MNSGRSGVRPEELTDELVDRVIAGRGHSEQDGLGRVAADLYALASEPLPVETRDRHLAAIHSHHVPVPTRRFASTRRRVAALAAGATATFTLFGGGAVAVAQNAAPGDLLYGLDRAAERVQLAVTLDEERKASVQLGLARERLEEASQKPEHADDLLDEALDHATQAAAVKGADALTVLGELAAAKENPRAAAAIYEACVAIADRHGHATDACGEAPETADDEAPGRSDEAPGRSGEAPGRSADADTDRRGSPEESDRGRSAEHRPGDAGTTDTEDDETDQPATTGTDRADEERPDPPTGPEDDDLGSTTAGDAGTERSDDASGEDVDGEDGVGAPPGGVGTGGPPSDEFGASTNSQRAGR